MPPVARKKIYDRACRQCPRLAAFLDDVRDKHPDYFAAPVPAFGDKNAKLLIVGLAPGYHGANRTGRPFTGDHAGILLYSTLHALGLATQAESVSASDNLRLLGCRITNAVKCLPPGNKPVGLEIRTCNQYLSAELDAAPAIVAILALGKIAHDAVLRSRGLKLSAWKFAHGAEHQLPGGVLLVDSYHCSRYNTQTKRLTKSMFVDVVARARDVAGLSGSY
jgi:uracil-DNA glycosylase family 4